jgi:D-glycero-D-manno-heptose 1,7-bisphosphate phosphatase
MTPLNLVILDRDGVINRDSDDFIKSAEEWVPIAGSLEAIARLNQNGFRVVIASNQSGIGRGLFDMGALNEIHAKMHRALAALGGKVDAVFFCPHAPEDRCECRKPKPGLFLQISARFSIDLAKTWSIGDSERDLVAAHSAGCRLMLVRTGKGRKTLDAGKLPPETLVFDDLSAAAEHILAPIERT